MQFLVPQFAETEDKIVGPLTLRQFLILLGAAGVCGILYIFLVLWLWAICAVLLFGFSVAFAILKINGRPFARLFVSALMFFWKPQIYVWKPNNTAVAKTAENMQQFAGGFSLEKIVGGMALSNAWRSVQTGNKAAAEEIKPALARQKEIFQVYSRVTGERHVAKRIDYR